MSGKQSSIYIPNFQFLLYLIDNICLFFLKKMIVKDSKFIKLITVMLNFRFLIMYNM